MGAPEPWGGAAFWGPGSGDGRAAVAPLEGRAERSAGPRNEGSPRIYIVLGIRDFLILTRISYSFIRIS